MPWSDSDMMRKSAAVEYASELAVAAQADFHQANQNFDWKTAESLRVTAVAAFEAYLDAVSAAYHKMEEMRPRGR